MKTRAHYRRLGVVRFFVMILGLILAVPGAFGGSAVGDFEIDGNLIDSPTGAAIDWSLDAAGNIPHPALPNRVTFSDASGLSDGIFGQGSKELEPGGWKCVTGSAPGKSDILKGSVAIRSIGQKRFMYVNFVRKTVDGDVHMDYEFNQSSEPNPACLAAGAEAPKKRTNGDVMITFDTEFGGKVITVRAFRWVGDHVIGNFTELPLGTQGVLWDAAVNIPSTIPGVEAGAFGEAVLNLTDSPIQLLCPEYGYMKTRASTAINSELKDRTTPLKVTFGDRSDLAFAHGNAFAARAVVNLLAIDQTISFASSTQHGAGRNQNSAQLLDVRVPPTDGSVLRADILRASSTSEIANGPAQAKDTGVSEAVNVNILNGLVTASVVRGVATATASGTASSVSSVGSAFTDLVVNGVAMNNVTPNTRVDLPAAVVGPGSYVMLYEQVGSTSSPAPGQIQGGRYAADLTVNMIHVYISDSASLLPGNQTMEVIVANAVADAEFPQRELCEIPPEQTVSGHAFVASATTDAAVLSTTIGYVGIPSTGGSDHQDLDQLTIGSAVSAQASASDSSGSLGGSESEASSYANVTGVCLLPTATGCTITATLINAQSSTSATASGAFSDDRGTTLVDVSVMGTPVNVTPPPNTVIDLPGIGYVILNEQICDDNASLIASCATAAGHAGLTVRNIHVVVTVPDNPTGLTPGAEVIVSEAHSDAGFVE